MKGSKTALLGGFVLLVLATLTYFTLRLSGISFSPQRDWDVYFGKNSVIQKGDEVQSSGKKVGTVTSVSLVSDSEVKEGHYVKAVLSVTPDLTLWPGARVVVARTGVLTSFVVNLERGDPTLPPLKPGTSLEGQTRHGLFDQLAGVVEKSQTDFVGIFKNAYEITKQMREGKGTVARLLNEPEVYDDFTRLLRTFNDIAERLDSNQSSLGRLLRDDQAARHLDTMLADAAEISRGIEQGHGLLGRLAKDEDLANRTVSLVKHADSILAAIDRGEGPAGLLIRGEKQRQELEEGIGALRDFAVSLRDGKGALGVLTTDPKMGDRVRRILEDIQTVTDHVRAGKGTVGELLMNDRIVRDLQALVESFQETGEVTRENAPLSNLVSFTSLFFNVLQ